MRKIKVILMLIILMITFSSISLKSYAESSYLKAKENGVVLSENKDNTAEIQSFLNKCKSENKDAYFESGIYILENNLNLVDGVSIIGDENTIFRGINGDYQINIFAASGISNIEIKNIIFDNVTIYQKSSGSNTNWQIENNIFINAKKVDVSIDGGLKPNGSFQNGGENTGYYLLIKGSNTTVSSNIFLRDENSLGRGVALYRTKNVNITDNYFGLVEDLDNGIVSDNVKKLKTKITNLDTYDSFSDAGHFETCINVISNDENVLIKGNHFSLNKNIDEKFYDLKQGDTLGYNRDHIIYAKEYINLDIVYNYFKGQNKNPDGGVKVRNGEDCLVYKNVFEDSLLLFYIQTGSSKNYLKDTYVTDNIFINQDYTNEKVGNLDKYFTTNYLIFLYNYLVNGVVDNFTIENNQFLSAGLANEAIETYAGAQTQIPTNFYIINNHNYLNEDVKINLKYGKNNVGTKYICQDLEKYSDLNVNNLVKLDEAKFKVKDKKLEGTSLYVDKKAYNGAVLKQDQTYEIFSVDSTTTTIKYDGKDTPFTYIEQEIPSYKYGVSEFNLVSSLDINLNFNEALSLKEYFDLEIFANYEVKTYDEAIFKVEKTNDDIIIKALKPENSTIVINLGGFDVTLNIIINSDVIYDFSIDDLTIEKNRKTKLDIKIQGDEPTNFSFIYSKSALSIENEEVLGLLEGTHTVKAIETYSGKEVIFKVNVNSVNSLNIKLSLAIGDVFNLSKDVSEFDINYDNEAFDVENNSVIALKAGNYVIEAKANNLTVTYEIEVKVKNDIITENLELKLGEEKTILLSYPYSDNLEFIYDDEAFSFDTDGYTVKAKKEGTHTLLIIDKELNVSKSIQIIIYNS